MQNVEKINALEDAYEKLSNEQLRAKSDDFRKKLRSVNVLFCFDISFLYLLLCHTLSHRRINLLPVRMVAHTSIMAITIVVM